MMLMTCLVLLNVQSMNKVGCQKDQELSLSLANWMSRSEDTLVECQGACDYDIRRQRSASAECKTIGSQMLKIGYQKTNRGRGVCDRAVSDGVSGVEDSVYQRYCLLGQMASQADSCLIVMRMSGGAPRSKDAVCRGLGVERTVNVVSIVDSCGACSFLATMGCIARQIQIAAGEVR
jgi:hypothetical protein